MGNKKPIYIDTQNDLNKYYNLFDLFKTDQNQLQSDLGILKAFEKVMVKSFNKQFDFIHKYNDYMRRTQGGEKIGGIFATGLKDSFVVKYGFNPLKDVLNVFSNFAQWGSDKIAIASQDNRFRWFYTAAGIGLLFTLISVIIFLSGVALASPLIHLLIGYLLALGTLDLIEALINLFKPYPGEIKAKNAEKELPEDNKWLKKHQKKILINSILLKLGNITVESFFWDCLNIAAEEKINEKDYLNKHRAYPVTEKDIEDVLNKTIKYYEQKIRNRDNFDFFNPNFDNTPLNYHEYPYFFGLLFEKLRVAYNSWGANEKNTALALNSTDVLWTSGMETLQGIYNQIKSSFTVPEELFVEQETLLSAIENSFNEVLNQNLRTAASNNALLES